MNVYIADILCPSSIYPAAKAVQTSERKTFNDIKQQKYRLYSSYVWQQSILTFYEGQQQTGQAE